MGEQLEFHNVLENMEQKKDVFYVRCRPTVKKVLLLQMHKDGWDSMADWFDQFVTKAFMNKRKPLKKKAKKKRAK